MIDEELVGAQAEAFGTVFLLVQHLTRSTDEALADWDLTTRQWLLLAVLARSFPDRDPSLTEAAEAYGSSRQNVKQIALGLAARGWLRLEPDPDDARTTRIVRTSKVAVFDQPEGVARSISLLSQAFDGIPRRDVLALRDLSVAWLQALSRAGAGATTPRR